ncbi:hypothetical protein [Paenibacillus sp. Y412MC10]|nr:hypothetical protein [Paenibacillus sp. Y412MC10]
MAKAKIIGQTITPFKRLTFGIMFRICVHDAGSHDTCNASINF